jgi:large subunit ribosomal protein L9
VSKSEIVDAVYQQTGRKLDEDILSVPDIKAVGTYEVSVSLHPEVTGTFNVVIQREKNAPGKKK